MMRVDTPGGVGEGLDELGFDGAFGPAFVEESLGVALVNGVILAGQDDGLAYESVAERVQFGTLLTGFGAGPVDFWALARLIAARSTGRGASWW
jgi:hypothetical protein